MNENAELLNFIYQNSQMGVDTLKQLIPIVDNEKFEAYLRGQLEGYKKIHEASRNMQNGSGYDEKGIHAFEKMATYLMINMKTMSDRSPAHISEMLIKGSNMGIIDAIKKIRRYEGSAEKEIVSLMRRLLKFEEENVEGLKEFLSIS